MKINKKSHPEVWAANPNLGNLAGMIGIAVDDEKYKEFRAEADRIYGHLSTREKEIAAIHLAMTHAGFHGEGSPEKAEVKTRPVDTHHTRLLVVILVVLSLLLILAIKSHAEPVPEFNIADAEVLANLKIFPANFFPQGVGIVPTNRFAFDASGNLNVNVAAGGASGGTSSSFAAAFPATGTAIGVKSGANMVNLAADGSNNLLVNCAVGCAGGSTTPTDAFANPTTAGLQFDFLAGFNGVTWDRLRVDGSKNLNVNCAVGCSAGSLTNNNAAPGANNSGVLPGLANAANPTWIEGNQVLFSADLSGNQRVKVNAALPAGSNVIGHVIADTGSTTAVTGNVTVVQPTGTSLHAVLDTTSTTAATQATGTNLHTVTDATSVTAATLSAETTKVIGTVRVLGNAGAVVDAAGQNVAAPANWLGVGCQFFTSPTTLTNGNGTYLNCDTASNLFTRMNSWLGSTAPTVGSKASANSIPVVVASDQGAIAVTLTSTTLTGTSTIAGGKTNNNAAPGATNIGALGSIANAATQTWTEGNLVAESVDLSGRQRIVGISGDNGVAATTNRAPTLPGVYQTSYLNGIAATQGRDAAVSVGSDGLLWTASLPAIRPASYHWSGSFAGSSTTVAAHIAGNATNVLLVTKISMTCTQTTAGILTITVNKTSAASTGGTAATLTAVPDDSTYAAASSVGQSFTGTGPTAGTPVGQIDAAKVGCGAATSVNDDIYILNLRQKPIVLRGTAQTLEIGVGAATTGGNYTVTFEGMEITTISP